MHYSRGTLRLDDGKEIQVRLIGRGGFTRAFVTKRGRPLVYLITEDQRDMSKRALSEMETRSPYLPAVTYVGDLDEYRSVYRMPLYRTPVTPQQSRAWWEYKVLRKCWKEAQNTVAERGYVEDFDPVYAGDQIMDLTIDCAGQREGITPGLIRALNLLRDAVGEYGSDYSFEFTPRNLSTSKSGHLILLDVTVSQEEALIGG